MDRRNFVKSSALLASGVAAAPSLNVLGSNEQVNIGVIGCGGRGRGHVAWAEKSGGTVVAVCDVDTHRMEQGAKRARNSEKVKRYQDLRKLLADSDIDAVVIATPNHWHALATIWACQAGKDVYVEKPVCHNIWEGQQMIAAARKYKRMVQSGTQGRSSPSIIKAREIMAAKELGELQWAHSFWYQHRGSIGNANGPQPIPDHIDYDLWCGPRPNVPLMRKKLHYDWHWFWPYGDGDMGNRAIHPVDDLHAILRIGADIPRDYISVGGRFKYGDDATTPNTHIVAAKWKVPIVFGCRNLPLVHPKTGKVGGTSVYWRLGKSFRWTSLIKCEDGFITVNREGGAVYDNDGNRIEKILGNGGGGHMRNFIEAVRSRKVSDLKSDIEEAVLANNMILAGNVSYRCGEEAPPELIASRFGFSEEPLETWKQTAEHLKRNKIDLQESPATLSPWLKLDLQKKRFAGDGSSAANEFIREFMRPEFSIPEEV